MDQGDQGSNDDRDDAGAEDAIALAIQAEINQDNIVDQPLVLMENDVDAAAVAIAAAAGVDWDDRLSWEDSERFEEDSLCSWLSEPESLIQNWRGWSSTTGGGGENGTSTGGNHHHHANSNNIANQGSNNQSGAGAAAAGIANASGGGSSHRHHHHHSNNRGGGCTSPTGGHHSNALNYNGGLLTVGHPINIKFGSGASDTRIFSLVELTAREVARSVPFELVERFYPPVPETLQLRVAFWSFPENEEDIRLYSCLANGNVDEFQKGEHLYRNRAVKDLLQIGFHLSGLVYQTATSNLLTTSAALNKRETNNGAGGGAGGGARCGHHHQNWSNNGGGGSGMNATSNISSTSPQCFNVAVTLDRRRITSCTCTCRPSVAAAWCAHVVAVCLHRIHQPQTVCLRAPVSESLSRLQRDQLQKFAQYLISELPRQILPTAQRLLDDLLSQSAPINAVCGAPDPTAGASLNESSWWCLEDLVLHENIRKILVKFCQPSPTVFSDVNYLSSSAPPAASEWQSLMRPLRGREPEGLWNLLSIVREMYKRHDSNAAKLLRIITTECLNCDQVVLWWYHTKLSQSLNGPHLLPGCALVLTSASSATGASGGKSSNNNNGGGGGGGALGGQTHSAQYSCASLFDEIVVLWRLLVLNPSLSPDDRQNFAHELRFYHTRAVEKVYRILGGGGSNGTVINANVGQHHQNNNHDHQHHGGGGGGGQNHHNHHHHGQQHHNHHHHANTLNIPGGGKLTWETARFDSQTFPGFLPALESCLIDWIDYPIDGVTYEPPRGRSPSYGSACGYLILKEFAQTGGVGSTSPASISPSTTNIDPIGGVPVLRDKQYRNFSALKTSREEKSTATTSKLSTASGGQKSKYDEIERLYLPEAQLDEEQNLDEASNMAAADVGRSGEERNRSWSNRHQQQQHRRRTPQDWADEAFRALIAKNDELDILSARCESLHAHGYRREAVRLAAHLTKRLMQNPPDLMVQIPSNESISANLSIGAGSRISTNNVGLGVGLATVSGQASTTSTNKNNGNGGGNSMTSTSGGRKKKRTASSVSTTTQSSNQQEAIFVHPRAMEVSQLASATLTRAIFLFSVLTDDVDYRQLAFQIGLWSLELPRQPAATKFLEVKMHYQESEIVSMLKQLPLAAEEMEMLRQRAHRLRSGAYHGVVGSISNASCIVAVASTNVKPPPAVVLPLSLASYVFDALSWPSSTPVSLAAAVSSNAGVQSSLHHHPSQQLQQQQHHNQSMMQQKANAYRAPGDEQLAFEAAVAALAMKSNVSEAEHPLLCEGIRRQKGDLALALLLRYRDHQEKLAVIMDRLLDHEMHQMYKHHASNAIYYGHYVRTAAAAPGGNAASTMSSISINSTPGNFPTSYQSPTSFRASIDRGGGGESNPSSNNNIQQQNSFSTSAASSTNQQAAMATAPSSSFLQRGVEGVVSRSSSTACFDEMDSDSVQNNTGEVSQLSETLDDLALLAPEDDDDYDLDEDNISARGEDDGSPFWMRAANVGGNATEAGVVVVVDAKSASVKTLRQQGSISDEAASAVSSSTATSTSDDSSSSGISTRGGGGGGLRLPNVGQLAAQASAQNQQRNGNQQEASIHQNAAANGNGSASAQNAAAATAGETGGNKVSATGGHAQRSSVDPLNKACYVKLNRHRRYVTPSIPNQPSEAHAHFMMELAKRLLIEAGGSHSTSIFTSQGSGPQANQGHGGGPHRQLHLCAFQIGLYSLGIHNKVTPNWLSRTYSSHVSWISGNAMEIGRTAIRILIDTWENHLTPTEAATLADKASQSRDPGMIQAAAELALSTLPQAHALNPTEIFRALAQCKEQTTAIMLEKACVAVEQAAKDYGVYPEVLFRVAQTWYQLYTDSTTTTPTTGNGAAEYHQQQALIGHFGEQPSQQQHQLMLHQQQQQHHFAQQQQQQQHHAAMEAAAQHHGYGGGHHHHVYGNNVRHHLNNGPPTNRPPQMHPPPVPAVPMCAPPPALLHQHQQQQMAAAYGLPQQFVPPPGPNGLPYLPPGLLRPQAPVSGAGQPPPPPPMVVVHHGATTPYQSHHHGPPLAALHHPPPSAQQAPPTQLPPSGPPASVPPPPPGQPPFFHHQQAAAAAALINAYHHNPYAAAHFAAVAAAAAASRNYNTPLMHHQQQQQMQQRNGQQQLSSTPQHHHHPPTSSHYHYGHLPLPSQGQQQQQQQHPNQQGPPPPPSSERHVDQAGGQSRFLYASYRVGMLALETLGRRINDDRAFTKYSQNPNYGDDVKWLLKISKRLGLMYVQQFCLVAAQSVPSPFVLWDLASEVAMLFSRSTNNSGQATASVPTSAINGGQQTNLVQVDVNPNTTQQQQVNNMALGQAQQMAQAMSIGGGHPPAALYKALMHPHVQPLVQRCLQMFYAAAQQKLSHPRFMPADTEEVCALAKAARTAFLHTPGGNVHFNEFLQSLRRQKACKKDVWNKILSHLNG